MKTIIALTAAMQASAKAVAWQNEFSNLPLARASQSFVLMQQNQAHGWYSMWNDAPPHPSYNTCCLGHFFAHTRHTALALLEHACQNARSLGKNFIIGPMDGDTWHSYRLTTDTCGHPPFFLDRLTPPEWPAWFEDAGFCTLARYFSSKGPSLGAPSGPLANSPWEERFQQGDEWLLRTLNLENFEEELSRIHALSLAAFARNFLYTPLALEDFLALYQPLRPLVLPELVTLAFYRQHLVGFCLCLPNYTKAQAGNQPDTLILKTLARHPHEHYRGLGAFLMQHARITAAKHGFSHVISAFMHADNTSLKLSMQYGQIIRHYALFGREI